MEKNSTPRKPIDVMNEIRTSISTQVENDFNFKRIDSDIGDIRKMLKRGDTLFYEVCRRYIGKTEGIDQRMISYEILAALIEKWPVLMMDLKSRLDAQLHL